MYTLAPKKCLYSILGYPKKYIIIISLSVHLPIFPTKTLKFGLNFKNSKKFVFVTLIRLDMYCPLSLTSYSYPKEIIIVSVKRVGEMTKRFLTGKYTVLEQKKK